MAFHYLTNIPLEKAREDYLELLRSHGFGPETETVPVQNSCGRINSRAVYAAICAPHYPASAMDGITLPEGLVPENENGRLYLFLQRNKMCVGDAAELVSPRQPGIPFTAREMYNIDGEPIESCPHPYMQFFLRVPFEVREGDILRAGDTN